MNFPCDYTRDLKFMAFKKAINHAGALGFVFNLCSRCQTGKTTELRIPREHFAAALDLPDEVDSEKVRDALVRNQMITPIEGKGPDWYYIDVFKENNAGLRACWKNGKLGGHPVANPDAARKFRQHVPAPAAEPDDEPVPF